MLLGLTACAAPFDRSAQRVVIANPHGAGLALESVRDGTIRALGVGGGKAIELRIPTGRWVLHANHSGRHWTLPLGLLSHVDRPRVLHLEVTPPPAPRDGLAWIPKGPGLRGDVLGVGQEHERPARLVQVDGFFLATQEVTNREYAEFLNESGGDPGEWLALDSLKCRIQQDGAGRHSTDAPDLPVVTVSHAGALAFCAWKTRITGERHRLPTEAEWEKAARGPGSRTYAYGDTYTQRLANQESGRLMPVASYEPNGFGVFDMTGNAFEWTADVYRADAYRAEAQSPPPVAESAEYPYRSLRGGSFVLDGIYLRNAMRMRLRPTVRADDIGFRYLVEPHP